MKKFLWITLLGLFVICSKETAVAVPAYPDSIAFSQPDKTVLTLFLKGDEWIHWGETHDGYRLLAGKNNDYVYAEPDGKGGMKPSDFLAHDQQNRTASENAFLATLSKDLFYSETQLNVMRQYAEVLRKSRAQNTQNSPMFEGTFRIPVVLMAFADQGFIYTREDFDALFNQVGYSVYGNNGSIKDYFAASSDGVLNLESVVLGPYTAEYNMAYYGAHSPDGSNDVNPRALIREAVEFAAADVDMRLFDNFGRGAVDAFYVIYAGFAESSGGGPNTIWPHRWVLYPAMQADGVYVSDYGCSSERQGTVDYPETPNIGTICHEFSHVLTLPDLYDTEYGGGSGFSAPHPGAWDLMASGSYNNGGKCPPLWSAWERESVGWLQYDNIESLNDVTLFPLHSHNQGIKIPVTGNSDEYFLLENRQQFGFDAYLPSNGMLIIHVDETVPGWSSNCANCDRTRLGYRIIPADNTSGMYQYSGLSYPGTSNNRSFTDSSVPAAQTVSGAGLGKPITNIKQHVSTHNIWFEYCQTAVGRPEVSTREISQQTATTFSVLGKVESQGNSAVTERGFVYGVTPNPTTADNVVIAGNGTNEFSSVLSNLTPATLYYVRAYAKNSSGTTYGQTLSVMLPCSSNSTYPYFVTFEDGKLPDCWETQKLGGNAQVATWICLDTQSVFHAPYLPYGGNYSVFLPAASETARHEMLITAPMDLSSLQQPLLQFHHIQPQNVSWSGNLSIYYRTAADQSWILLQTYSTAVDTWTEQSIVLPDAASATYQIAFAGKTFQGASVGLDNIAIVENHVSVLPGVRTENVLGVDHSEINISGNVLTAGSSSVIERGFCWNTKGNPSLMDQYKTASGSGLGMYSLIIDSLQPSTTYYVRAYARNANSVVYGEQYQVKTFCEPQLGLPLAENFEQLLEESCLREQWQPTETIHWERCMGNGNNQPSAAVSGTYNYCYKATEGTHRSKLIFPILSIEGWDSVKLKFYQARASVAGRHDTLKVYYKNGLQEDWTLLQTYDNAMNTWTLDSLSLSTVSDRFYLAFEAITAGGAGVCIDQVEIQGYYPLPILHTLPISYISDHSFVANGQILLSGQSEVLEHGFCYGTERRPTIENNKQIVRGSTEQFSDTIQNLQALTTYYIRAYATNRQGTAYGEEVVVNTAPERIRNNIIQGDQEGCLNTSFEMITGNIPSGGYGDYSYLWLESSDSLTWDTVEFFTQAFLQNYTPERITVTTYFCRVVHSGESVDTSNVVRIVIYYPSRGGNVFPSEDTVMLGEQTQLELRAFRGTVVKWEARHGELNWQVVDSGNCTALLTTVPTHAGKWQYRALVQNGDCAPEYSGVDEIWVKDGVGLEEPGCEEKVFAIIPNPNNGVFKLVIPRKETIRLRVVDMQGRWVFDEEIDALNTEEINLSYLDAGYYTVSVSGKTFTATQKLIIRKP